MDNPAPLSPEQRAELVAYLDGELPEDDTLAMERVLAKSSEARHEVDMLSRTFALLDTLPRPGASSEFSAKTLASLKAEKTALPWKQRTWYRNCRRGAAATCWLLGLVLAGMLGFYAANRLARNDKAALVRELPVIERLDSYSDVDGIDFLKELDKQRVFDEEEPDVKD